MVAKEIDRRIVGDFPDMRTSSEAMEEATGTGNALVMSVFEMPRGAKWNHFADFAIRSRQIGPGRYAVDVSCSITEIEAREDRIRLDRTRIESLLKEHDSLGVAARETTRYRRGIPQLGEAEDEVISRHYVEFRFGVASVVQSLDDIEAGSTVGGIGELAITRLKAMREIARHSESDNKDG